MALGEYPLPCAERSFEGISRLRMVLPDECTSITVIVSYTGGSDNDPEAVTVNVLAASVTDSFGRNRTQGWGPSDHGRPWRDRDGTRVEGSVIAREPDRPPYFTP